MLTDLLMLPSSGEGGETATMEQLTGARKTVELFHSKY